MNQLNLSVSLLQVILAFYPREQKKGIENKTKDGIRKRDTEPMENGGGRY